jgi:hypothetical protein
MSSFDSFADTEGAAGYTQEVNQLWSASKVGYNMPEVMKNLTHLAYTKNHLTAL